MAKRAWSYSRLSVYEECPQKYKYKFIDKMGEPSNEAMDRGRMLDDACGAFLNTGIWADCMPRYMENRMRGIRDRGAKSQVELAFDDDWTRVNWFSKATRCRVKIDALVPPVKGKWPLEIIDFKTGKVREPKEYGGTIKDPHGDQLELYAIGGFLASAGEDEIKTALWYLDATEEKSRFRERIYRRSDLPGLMKKWADRVAPHLADITLAPDPGRQCGWCHFSVENGGPCTAGRLPVDGW